MATLANRIMVTARAYKQCEKEGKNLWAEKHFDKLREYEAMLPSGSGFDSGCTILIDKTVATGKIQITTSFHHMDENGMYDGWTEHNVVITPDFGSIFVNVTGINKNNIKEYISEVFYTLLEEEI